MGSSNGKNLQSAKPMPAVLDAVTMLNDHLSRLDQPLKQFRKLEDGVSEIPVTTDEGVRAKNCLNQGIEIVIHLTALCSQFQETDRELKKLINNESPVTNIAKCLENLQDTYHSIHQEYPRLKEDLKKVSTEIDALLLQWNPTLVRKITAYFFTSPVPDPTLQPMLQSARHTAQKIDSRLEELLRSTKIVGKVLFKSEPVVKVISDLLGLYRKTHLTTNRNLHTAEVFVRGLGALVAMRLSNPRCKFQDIKEECKKIVSQLTKIRGLSLNAREMKHLLKISSGDIPSAGDGKKIVQLVRAADVNRCLKKIHETDEKYKMLEDHLIELAASTKSANSAVIQLRNMLMDDGKLVEELAPDGLFDKMKMRLGRIFFGKNFLLRTRKRVDSELREIEFGTGEMVKHIESLEAEVRDTCNEVEHLYKAVTSGT